MRPLRSRAAATRPWPLRSGDEYVAANAAEVLGDSGDSTRLEELEALYDHWPGEGHSDPRLSAVNASARLWPERSMRLLRRALRDPNRQVRGAAAAALD